MTTCLFHSETTKYWFIAWKYVFLSRILNKNQSVLIAKISSHKTQKIANPQKINYRKNFVPHGMLFILLNRIYVSLFITAAEIIC